VIPVEDGRAARQLLETEGYSPEYYEYRMAHEITAEVIADLTRWLRRILPPAA
jgi:phospholipase/carboxylesterase